jgi:hypothetical protein
VWDYCLSHEVTFKFLRSRPLLHVRNAKYAPRGAGGKIVAIFAEPRAPASARPEMAGRASPWWEARRRSASATQ